MRMPTTAGLHLKHCLLALVEYTKAIIGVTVFMVLNVDYNVLFHQCHCSLKSEKSTCRPGRGAANTHNMLCGGAP